MNVYQKSKTIKLRIILILFLRIEQWIVICWKNSDIDYSILVFWSCSKLLSNIVHLLCYICSNTHTVYTGADICNNIVFCCSSWILHTLGSKMYIYCIVDYSSSTYCTIPHQVLLCQYYLGLRRLMIRFVTLVCHLFQPCLCQDLWV